MTRVVTDERLDEGFDLSIGVFPVEATGEPVGTAVVFERCRGNILPRSVKVARYRSNERQKPENGHVINFLFPSSSISSLSN